MDKEILSTLWGFVLVIFDSEKAFKDARSEVGRENFVQAARAARACGYITDESFSLIEAGKWPGSEKP